MLKACFLIRIRERVVSSCAICIILLLIATGCGLDTPEKEEAATRDDSLFALTGVPVSPQLADILDDEARATDPNAPSNRAPWTGYAAVLALGDELEVGTQRPANRTEAGRRLYDAWRNDPRNLFWIQTAVRYEYLLHRKQDLDDMFTALATADSTDPALVFGQGNQLYGRGDRGEHFRRAASRMNDLDDFGRVLLSLKLAMVEADTGDPLAAVDRLLAILPDSRVGGPWLRMRVWFDIATYLKRADRLDDAMHAAAAGMTLCRLTGSDFWWGRYLVLTAILREARRETDASLALFEESSRYGELHDLSWIFLDGTQRAGSLCSALGDPARALYFDRKALAHSIAIRDSLNAPRGMMNIADDFRTLGELDSSLVYLELAQSWVNAFPDPRNRAMLPRLAADYYCQLGEYATADSLMALARNRTATAGLRIDEANLLLDMIKQGLEMGQPDLAYQAIARLNELRDVFHDEQPDQNMVADNETATAEFLTGQGEYVLAREALDRAAAAIAHGGGEQKSWRYHRCAGELALVRGDLATAEAAFGECLALARRIGNADLEAASRFHMGNHLLRTDRPAAALALFTEATDSGRFGGRFRQRLETMIFRGRALSAAGDPQAAVAQLRRVEALLTPHTPSDLVALARFELGRALAVTGAFTEATDNLTSAQEHLHDVTRSPSPEMRAFTSDMSRNIVTTLVEIRLYGSDVPADRDGIRTALGTALSQLQDTADPDAALKALVADGALATVYLVGETRSHVWVIDGEHVTVQELPGREALARLVAPVLSDLTTPLRSVDGDRLAALSTLLLDPVLPVWDPGRLWRIVTDDLLASLPWGALPIDADGTPALTRGPVIEAAVGHHVAKHPHTTTGTMLAVGLDDHGGGQSPQADLHHAEAEARAVAARWPADRVELRTGPAATWPEILSAGLARASVLHLATHAVVHQGASERASLRLAGSEDAAPVTLRSLGSLDLETDLIYLSCCEGAKTSRSGAGLTGFARAFLAAGARTVVASTIRVDDEASRELAMRFYDHWLQGLNKAAALRAAQLDLREARPAWRHPYYWSFYRIIGEAD